MLTGGVRAVFTQWYNIMLTGGVRAVFTQWYNIMLTGEVRAVFTQWHIIFLLTELCRDVRQDALIQMIRCRVFRHHQLLRLVI